MMPARVVDYDPHADWPEPQELPSQLLPVEPFDPELLPDELRAWALDIADRMQAPLDYVAVSALVAAAAIVGRKVSIRPLEKGDWREVPNLWACIVGSPGSFKSPTMKQALSPIRKLDVLAAVENKRAMELFASEMKSFKTNEAVRMKELKKGPMRGLEPDWPEPAKPPEKRFIVNDATYEKLGEILAENPNGVLYFRDELVSFLKPLDREENAAAKGFMLAAWNGGDPYTFDRIGRGRTHIECCCVSVLGATQPSKLAAYLQEVVRGGSTDDGMVQRFGLLVWPDASQDWHDVDRFPDATARLAANQLYERLNGLEPEHVGAQTDAFDPLPYLRFDAEAQARFRSWRTAHERRIRQPDTMHPTLEAHISKYRGLVPKLALLFHLIDRGVGPVGQAAVIRAVAWAEYLESHARRAYGFVLGCAELQGAKTIIARIQSGDLGRRFKARDIYQRGWTGLADREATAAALSLLVEYDWLTEEAHAPETGRPTTIYTANPRGLE